MNNIVSNINYDEIDLLAQRSLLKEVCMFYNNNLKYSYNKIGERFNINRQTVYNYIKKGKELGIVKTV